MTIPEKNSAKIKTTSEAERFFTATKSTLTRQLLNQPIQVRFIGIDCCCVIVACYTLLVVVIIVDGCLTPSHFHSFLGLRRYRSHPFYVQTAPSSHHRSFAKAAWPSKATF
jgi:hypothetical protein